MTGTVKLDMRAGERVAIELLYEQRVAWKSLSLLWKTSSTPFQPIPAKYLRHRLHGLCLLVRNLADSNV